MHIEPPVGASALSAEFLRSVVEFTEATMPMLAREMAIEEDRLFDMNDLLRRLPFSRKVVLRMIQEGRIPAYMLNDKWVIARATFVDALRAGFPVPSGRHRTNSR